MKVIELKGHSGCKVLLIVPDEGKSFVRKISKSVDYNQRLRCQCLKQKNFHSSYARVPRVYDEGQKEGLYYFDMEYVRGTLVSSFMRSCSVDQVHHMANFLVHIVGEFKRTSKSTADIPLLIGDKLKSLYDNMTEIRHQDPIKKAYQMLSNYDWSGLESSSCHGDLTLENIIFGSDGNYYLIDFLDTFFESWIADVSKLLQDLLVGWSFRHDFVQQNAISENAKLKVLLLNRQFSFDMNQIFHSSKIWEDIYLYLLMDLLRIVPYIEDQQIYRFTIQSMDAIINEIERGGLYEYINTTMCWPVCSLSRR